MIVSRESYINKARSIAQFKSRLNSNEFKVFKVENDCLTNLNSNDFYQFYFFSGKMSGNGSNNGVLCLNPYSKNKVVSLKNIEYGCAFSKSFLKHSGRSHSQIQLSLAKLGSSPIIKINDEEFEFLKILLKRMINEEINGRDQNEEIMHNYLRLIVHELMKTDSCSSRDLNQNNATTRIVNNFFELLESQFPVKCKHTPIGLRTAQGFADSMLLHATHLNRSLKMLTNKTTKTLINERITVEAIEILLSTEWNISEIAHALGFEHSSYFNNFFKRMTSTNPTKIRENKLENHKYKFGFHNHGGSRLVNFTN